MGRIITTARWIPDKIYVQEVDRGNGMKEIVKGLDAISFLPRGEKIIEMRVPKKKRPWWVRYAVMISVLALNIYTLMFASILLHNEFLFLALGILTYGWTAIVMYATVRKKNRSCSADKNGSANF